MTEVFTVVKLCPVCEFVKSNLRSPMLPVKGFECFTCGLDFSEILPDPPESRTHPPR